MNLTFPPVEPPPPPPAIDVTVYRTVDGRREDTRGVVPIGTPLILAIKPSSKTVDVREVQVQGGVESFRSDPLKGQPTGADWIVEYTPGAVGTYRVELTGLGASQSGTAEAVKGGTTFRVIGAGGTDDIVEGARPEVIPARTIPRSNATGVPVSTFLQVMFTEPVRKTSGNVRLSKVLPSPSTPPPLSAPIAVRLSGVLRHGGGVVEDLDQSPDAAVTSLTVQPLSGLEYGATYRLDLTDGIEDLDTTPCGPAANLPPCKLVPYETKFTTFSPMNLSTNAESFGSPGIVVLGERSYLVENHFHAGTLRVFDMTDPVTPFEIPSSAVDIRDPRYTVSHRPVDLVGESESPLTGGRVVAVVTGSTAQSKPSNVWVLDTSDDRKTQWIGAVSLTSTAAEGFVSRTFLRAGVLYAATFRKGIQIVDLGKVKDAFKAPGTPEYFQMSQAFLTNGQGYGQENVTNIPVSSPFGGPARLNDIEAALTQTTDGAQVLVAAAGDPGLTVANPATQSVLWNDKVAYEREVDGQTVVEATLRYGQAIGLVNVAGQDLAVVVGTGTILQEAQNRPLLMVVSLYDPRNPVGLGYVPLDDATVDDVILKDDLAVLGGSKQVTLVSLTDKTRPKVLGVATGVGGRLALGEGSRSNILVSTAHSVFGGATPLGGIRVATLGSIVLLLDKDKNVLPRIKLPKNTATYVRALVPAAGDTVEGVEVSIIEKDGSVRKQTGPIPTQTTLTLTRDTETGQYLAPLKIVDKDCALELEHNAIDEQVVKTPCQGDLESGPWTRLRIRLPAAYGGLERTVDIRAFRLVAIGDSLTQGVQHGIVVHQDQRHAYPAQLADQINLYLKSKYGQQVVFKQAMIAEPGIGKPPLRAPHGLGANPALDFPYPGRLNPETQPVNNMGLSGARVAHLHTAKEGRWPTYKAETPWVCKKHPERCKAYSSPILNPDEPKSVWRYSLAPPEAPGRDLGTAVDQACLLDPSLLLILIGNNDALNAPAASEMRELTSVDDFQARYDALIEAVLACSDGRADIIVGTIPAVATIPHMRDLGDVVGPVPFTLPGVPAPLEADLSRGFEKMYLSPFDENDVCHGRAESGVCLGAKVGIGTIGEALAAKGAVGAAVTLIRQSDRARRAFGWKELQLTAEQVMDPDELLAVQTNVDLFNEHVRGWAQERGWPVMDFAHLFNDRTTEFAKSDSSRLNGLFTGTPRAVRLEGDTFLRGVGNTMLGWDGVHPNSAGYSVAANEVIRVFNGKLVTSEFGGLGKGAVIDRVPKGRVTELLKENYLILPWSRIFGWQDYITTVE